MPFNNSKFNIASQQDFIRKHAEIVRYFKGMKCTCTLISEGSNYPDANRARLDCKACHGLGWVWIEQGEIRGLVTNISQDKNLLVAGIAAPGDLIFSPTLDVTMADYDKIQFTWPQGIPYEGELVVRGSDQDLAYNQDNVRYGILDIGDKDCIQVDPASGAITYFKPNVDYTYNDRVITWIGNMPASGSVYSIKYQANIEWIAFIPPQPRKERGTNLGQKVILKKKHLVAFGQ